MQLLLMLQSKQRLRVEDIAEEFQVSRRTVFRDLRVLQEMEIPITHDPVEGYGIMRGGTIPPLMFTQKELATILMGLSFVKAQMDQTLVNDARQVSNKIRNVLPGELQDFMTGLESHTLVFPHQQYNLSKTEGGNWFTISLCIANERALRFTYRDKEDQKSSRVIDPLLLVYFSDHWNVIGFCHERRTPRNFILERMSDVMIEGTFKGGSREGYKTKELLYDKNDNTHSVRISVHPSVLNRFLAGLPSRADYVETGSSGWHEVRFAFDNLEFINTWLLQFAGNVTINAPEELISLRRRLLKDLLP